MPTPFESSPAVLTTLAQEWDYLAALGELPGVRLSRLATTTAGRAVPMLTIGTGTGKPAVLIAGTHAGDEVMPREAALTFARDVIESTDGAWRQFLADRYLIIIPTLNPDGRALVTRTNAQGVDLNRDMMKVTQPESRGLTSLFATRVPIAFYDGHENLGATTQQDMEYEAGMLAAMSTGVHAYTHTALTRSVVAALTTAGVSQGWYQSSRTPNRVHLVMPLHGAHGAVVESGHQGGTATDWAQPATRLDRYGWQRLAMAAWLDDVAANAAAYDASTVAGRAAVASRSAGTAQWDVSGHLGNPAYAASAGTVVTATGYTLTGAQYATATAAMTAHGIVSTTSDGGTTYTVDLAQPSAALAVHLLDPAASERLVDGTRIP